MTIESFQDTLFEDPIGLRFRHAREKGRVSIESVAQQLKLPVAILDAIEREDWVRLGAPIFVRSYVGSYAKFLGLPATLADEVVRGKPAPQLASVGSGAAPRRNFDKSLTNLAYLAMTVVIVGSVVMLAMYFQAPKRNADVLPLDSLSTYASTTGLAPGGKVDESTVSASLAPPMPAQAAANELVLKFRADSWVDLVDRNGVHVERGLVTAGAERRFAEGQLAEVTLGDSTVVDASLAGSPLDLGPYREAKVAHFTVSSDGTIGSPASH